MYNRLPHELGRGEETEFDTVVDSGESQTNPDGTSFSPEQEIQSAREIVSDTLPFRISRIAPIYTFALVGSWLFMYTFDDDLSCSQPLFWWSSMYILRHVVKAVLYHIASHQAYRGLTLPQSLIFAIALVDVAGSTIWALGGYYIFHTDSCTPSIFTYSVTLWSLQSISLLLPCCLVSTILFCAPCLLWLAPYFIRPNPNTIATSRDVLAKMERMPYGLVSGSTEGICCSICLNEYASDDEVMKLPCKHIFHTPCISEWAYLSQLCPVCRTNIASELSDSENSVIV